MGLALPEEAEARWRLYVREGGDADGVVLG